MCYLCRMDNPFGIEDLSKQDLIIKKRRAKLIKETLNHLEIEPICEDGQKEVDKLKEEQYKLSRDM